MGTAYDLARFLDPQRFQYEEALAEMKLRSSMTLFDAASPGDIFAQVLDTFYGGKRDPMTLELLKRN